MGLYSKIKRMVTMFCTMIVLSTLTMLALRLTVLSDMAVTVSAGIPDAPPGPQSGDIEDGDYFPYGLNPDIYFPKADVGGEVMILNPDANKYLLSVNILLPETKDSLYYTGAIAPGTYIKSAELSAAGKKLSNGVYPCIAEISAVDPETMAKVETEKKEVTIYIGQKP